MSVAQKVQKGVISVAGVIQADYHKDVEVLVTP